MLLSIPSRTGPSTKCNEVSTNIYRVLAASNMVASTHTILWNKTYCAEHLEGS